jgi:hypothetical protein
MNWRYPVKENMMNLLIRKLEVNDLDNLPEIDNVFTYIGKLKKRESEGKWSGPANMREWKKNVYVTF